MSLPAELQERLVHALPGLERARMIRPGYAVEYDFIQPTELTQSLETRRVSRPVSRGTDQRDVRLRGGRGPGAGRRNQRGTPGVRPSRPSRFGRDEAYIGILVDDLTTQGLPRTVSDVHVAGRASPAAADRQRGLAPDTARSRDRPGRRRAVGALRGSQAPFRCGTREAVRRAVVTAPSGARVPAARALKQPEVRLEALMESGQVSLEIDPGHRAHRRGQRRDRVQVRGLSPPPGRCRRSPASS